MKDNFSLIPFYIFLLSFVFLCLASIFGISNQTPRKIVYLDPLKFYEANYSEPLEDIQEQAAATIGDSVQQLDIQCSNKSTLIKYMQYCLIAGIILIPIAFVTIMTDMDKDNYNGDLNITLLMEHQDNLNMTYNNITISSNNLSFFLGVLDDYSNRLNGYAGLFIASIFGMYTLISVRIIKIPAIYKKTLFLLLWILGGFFLLNTFRYLNLTGAITNLFINADPTNKLLMDIIFIKDIQILQEITIWISNNQLLTIIFAFIFYILTTFIPFYYTHIRKE